MNNIVMIRVDRSAAIQISQALVMTGRHLAAACDDRAVGPGSGAAIAGFLRPAAGARLAASARIPCCSHSTSRAGYAHAWAHPDAGLCGPDGPRSGPAISVLCSCGRVVQNGRRAAQVRWPEPGC